MRDVKQAVTSTSLEFREVQAREFEHGQQRDSIRSWKHEIIKGLSADEKRVSLRWHEDETLKKVWEVTRDKENKPEAYRLASQVKKVFQGDGNDRSVQKLLIGLRTYHLI